MSNVFNIGVTVAAQTLLGRTYQQYRPTGVGPVIAAGNLIGPIQAWITGDDKLTARKAKTFGKPVVYAAFDPTMTMPGDYLVGAVRDGGPAYTFYVASQDVPEPIQLIWCNAVLNFTRPGAPATGTSYYGGAVTTSETPLLTGWPAAVLSGTKGDRGESTLPGDVKLGWFKMLVPSVAGVQLRTSDIAYDNETLQLRYTIGQAEITNLGWRLNAALAAN